MENEISINYWKRFETINSRIEKKKEECINRIKSGHYDSAMTIIDDLKKLTENLYILNQIKEGYINI